MSARKREQEKTRQAGNEGFGTSSCGMPFSVSGIGEIARDITESHVQIADDFPASNVEPKKTTR